MPSLIIFYGIRVSSIFFTYDTILVNWYTFYIIEFNKLIYGKRAAFTAALWTVSITSDKAHGRTAPCTGRSSMTIRCLSACKRNDLDVSDAWTKIEKRATIPRERLFLIIAPLEINFAIVLHDDNHRGVFSALRTKDFIEIINYPPLLLDGELGVNYDRKRLQQSR